MKKARENGTKRMNDRGVVDDALHTDDVGPLSIFIMMY